MNKVLIVVDMQNDFVTGALANPAAEAIIPNIAAKIKQYQRNGDTVVFTRDTHTVDYLDTPEGKKLPVPHCIHGTWGWLVVDELNHPECQHIDKRTFGYRDWNYEDINCLYEVEAIELVGTCTDICVVSNALLLKTFYPKVEITVDPSCCAGVSPETHEAALTVMKMCQINIKEDYHCD